jgi:hypothetical protein
MNPFETQGRFYGYPQCCIDEFQSLEHCGGPVRKLEGTGFIPCKQCDALKTETALIDEINDRRHPSLNPFPQRGLR